MPNVQYEFDHNTEKDTAKPVMINITRCNNASFNFFSNTQATQMNLKFIGL